MLLGVATNAQTRSVSGFPRVGGGGGGRGGLWSAVRVPLRVSSTVTPPPRRQVGAAAGTGGKQGEEETRRRTGPPVPLLQQLAGWLGEGGRQNPARIKAEARSADPDAN